MMAETERNIVKLTSIVISTAISHPKNNKKITYVTLFALCQLSLGH